MLDIMEFISSSDKKILMKNPFVYSLYVLETH